MKKFYLLTYSSSPAWTMFELLSLDKFKDWYETGMNSELKELQTMAIS